MLKMVRIETISPRRNIHSPSLARRHPIVFNATGRAALAAGCCWKLLSETVIIRKLHIWLGALFLSVWSSLAYILNIKVAVVTVTRNA